MKTRSQYLRQLTEELDQLEEDIEKAKTAFLNAAQETKWARMQALSKIIDKKSWLKRHISSLQLESEASWEEARVELEESWAHLRIALKKLMNS